MDLGTKCKSMQEKNQARALLVGAPLLLAQLGALEFRKKMMSGDTSSLRTMRLGDRMSVAEFLKKLGRIPPLAMFNVLYGRKDLDFSE